MTGRLTPAGSSYGIADPPIGLTPERWAMRDASGS
jgi:hypothetical protein